MAANTIAMYFKCDPDALQQPETWDILKGLGEKALGKLRCEPVVVDMGSPSDKLYVFQGENQGHSTMRVYDHGLATLDIQYYVSTVGIPHDQHPYNMAELAVKRPYAVSNTKTTQLSEEYIRALSKKLEKYLGDLCKESNCVFCPIRRGQSVWPYAVTADERLQELDYDELVCEKNSTYQNIRIFHSKEHGNVLFLDGDAMLGESDLIYTQTLCCIGRDSYKDKKVLILGGGDGGILHELLKEDPEFITMAEIDEEVIYACRKHMRSVCGTDMDKFEGPNYKIAIDDCVAQLHAFVQSGNLQDVVINDLTEFPVDKQVKGYGYDFDTTSLITELSLKALKPGGKILARGNCLSAYDYREKFEGDLETMGCDFKRKDVYVPSFEEVYCLYEIWKKAENGIKENGTR